MADNVVTKSIIEEAKAKINKKRHEKYVSLLVLKMEALEQAKQIVRNLEREITDLEIQIDEETGS